MDLIGGRIQRINKIKAQSSEMNSAGNVLKMVEKEAWPAIVCERV